MTFISLFPICIQNTSDNVDIRSRNLLSRVTHVSHDTLKLRVRRRVAPGFMSYVHKYDCKSDC